MGMLVLYILTSAGHLGPNPVGQTANYQNPLIVPAGYAFAIWSIIYLGIIVFPIYQWVKRREGHPLWNQVNHWFAANVLMNGIWLAFASYNWLWLSVVIIILMLFSLYKINELLVEIHSANDPINFWTERVVFSIYFGWITLATVLNISAALQFYQWQRVGISEQLWTVVISIIASIIAGCVFWKYRDGFYAGVIVWAFTALAIRHMNSDVLITSLSGGIVIVFLLLIVFKSKRILKNFD